MADLQQLREIARRLRELQRTSPTVAADLASWDASARNLLESLQVELPIQVMHYLHDADLRIKDAEHRQSQNEMLNGVILDLESGQISKSTGLTFSLNVRWLVLIALAALVALGLALIQ